MAAKPCERTTATSSSSININIINNNNIIIIIIIIDTWVVATDELMNSSDTLGDLHLPVAQRRAPTWTGHVPGCVVQCLGPKNGGELQPLPADVAQARAFDHKIEHDDRGWFTTLKVYLPVLFSAHNLSVADLLQFCSESVGHCIACFLRCRLLDNANYDMFSKDEWAISKKKLRLVTNGDLAWVENSCLTCTKLVTTKHVKLRWKHWGGML